MRWFRKAQPPESFAVVELVETPLLEYKMNTFNLKLQNNMTIFDARLDNGIYFISVKDAKGNVYNSEKIIVIK